MPSRRSLSLVVVALTLSFVFGMTDERITRLAHGPIADAANSRWLWACWPLIVGLAVGGAARGAVAGALGTPLALAGFYVVHDRSLTHAINGTSALLTVGLVVGVVAGALGGAVHSAMRNLRS